MSGDVDWEVFLGGRWERMGVLEVDFLNEMEREGKRTAKGTFREQEYEFDIRAMTQTNVATKKVRNVRRAGVMVAPFVKKYRSDKPENEPVPVRLNVYHVGKSEGILSIRTANGLLTILGSGAYHAAVEIYDMEWSFGEISEGTGVFWCEPRQCSMHEYYKTVELGTTRKPRQKVDQILNELKHEWQGVDYDLLRKNCCHFSNEFAILLGVDPLPDWVLNLARVGTTLEETMKKGADMRSGPSDQFRANSYHLGDVTRGIVATGKEARGVTMYDCGRYDDLLRGIGKVCCDSNSCVVQ